MLIIPNLDQQTPEWHRWRDGGLGGSDIGPIVLGDEWPFPDSRVERLLARKLGREKPAENTFVMRRGQYMEADVRMWFRQTHLSPGLMCEPVCVQHDEIEWMRASLDGLVYEPIIAPNGRTNLLNVRRLSVVEIKVPNWQAHSAALAGVVPDYYVPQVQYQLLVTGLDALDYVSYGINDRFGEKDKYAVVRVTPDAEKQAEIYEKCEAFWQRLCELRTGQREHEHAGT